MAEKGCNVMVPRLGDNSVEWGASVLLRPRGRAVQHHGARAVLLDLTGELRRLCCNLAMTTARQRQHLSSFADKTIVCVWGGGVYIRETPGVLCKDSSTEFMYNTFLQPSIFIRIQ
jgi:hypothetical protein